MDEPVTVHAATGIPWQKRYLAAIIAGFEDMGAEWRQRGLDPRTVNMVTGPSRSADIGQTLQLGAHGPVALHVFVIDS